MPSRFGPVQLPPILTARGSEAQLRAAGFAALTEIGLLAQSEVRRRIRTTKDVRGFVGRQDTAIMANSVTARPPTVVGSKLVQVTFSQPPGSTRAIVHELRRRPGRRQPPVHRIRSWVARSTEGRALAAQFQAQREAAGRKPLPRRQLLNQVAFVVARSIARKGIPGLGMFKAVRAELASGRARRIYQKHLARLAR